MSISRTILNAVSAVLDDGAYVNLAIKDALRELDARQKKLVTATVHTLLEHIMYVDYIIAHYAKGKLNRRIRNILRIGVARAVFMHSPQNAVCNEIVGLTREIGKSALTGFVNGVMRNVCRDITDNALPPLPSDTREAMSIEYSWPMWAVTQYCDRFGEAETRELLKPHKFGLSIRPQSPYTESELESYLTQNHISFTRGMYAPGIFKLSDSADILNSGIFKDGMITVQSESSVLACLATGIKPGMKVLDACAAPGGKSALLASLMNGEGEITAWDIHEHRVELINKTLERLNVTNVKAQVNDATISRQELYGVFDIVLVDAPCSGLGVTGKPDIRYKATQESQKELSQLQLKILNTVSDYVKPGGTLLYSTCTISESENECVVDEFLTNDERFTAYDGIFLPKPLQSRAKQGRITLLPHIDQTNGFFIAGMVRKHGI